MQMWEEVVEPACSQFDLRLLRADKLAEPGEITEQIFVLLRDADVVIADLSGGNPNVMYELGLRHTRDKLTIQIGEYDRLPFDVNTIRTIQFRRSAAGLIEARQNLVETLRAGLEGRGTPVTATRVWNHGAPVVPMDLAAAAARSQETDDEINLPDERGSVDVLAEGEASLEQMTSILESLVVSINEFGTLSNHAVERIGESDSRGGGFAGRLNVARQLANELKQPAEQFEDQANEYFDLVEKADAAMQFIIDNAISNPAELEANPEFFGHVVTLSEGATEASVGMTQMLQAAQDMRKISSVLVGPSKIIVRCINRIIKGNEIIKSWGNRLVEIPGWNESEDVADGE